MMTIPTVKSFFDPETNTVSYVVSDPETMNCAVIDSLLDYDSTSGKILTHSANQLIEYIRASDLTLDWIIDTHIHADHLSAAHYIKETLGGRTAIGEHIQDVQKIFGELFNEDLSFATDGRQFDHLFKDGEYYRIGNIPAFSYHTPGHTPACMSHHIGDSVFVGDTLFMPDFGTARCDFPGGDARTLYRSIQKIFKLPEKTRMFLCHDYKTASRDEYIWETTVGDQKRENIHVKYGISEDSFISMRTARDKTLSMPKLILPSVQINMRAGTLPPPESNGRQYVKIPLNAL